MAFKAKWNNPSGTRTYYAWRSARRRCADTGDRNYGGRGIEMCERWRSSYDAFVDDMGLVPDDTLTLERIDVNRGYEPSNCVWADWDTQRANTRTSVIIEHDGLSMTLSQWARHLGLASSTLWRRLNTYGMPVSEALSSGSLKERPDWQHGTRKGYEAAGCRCDECKAANAERARRYRMATKGQDDGQAD